MADTGARTPLTLSVVVPAFDEGDAIEPLSLIHI